MHAGNCGSYIVYKETKYHHTGYMFPRRLLKKKQPPFNKTQEMNRRVRQRQAFA